MMENIISKTEPMLEEINTLIKLYVKTGDFGQSAGEDTDTVIKRIGKKRDKRSYSFWSDEHIKELQED
jgi:hypothetical protein